MRFSLSLTVSQAAAFQCLDLLSADDLVGLAMSWLEAGSASPAIAMLAGETHPIMSDCAPIFERALQEESVARPGRRTAAWIAIQTILDAGLRGEIKIEHCVVELMKNFHNGEFFLFPLQNPCDDPVAWAGEELGFQRLIDPYHSFLSVKRDASEPSAELLNEMLEAAAWTRRNYYAALPDLDESVCDRALYREALLRAE
ncbi:MAG: hypothetical protein R3C30_10870 [Hyphomonadaceae bacterium]